MAQTLRLWLLICLIFTLGFGQLLRFDLFGLPLYLHDLLVFTLLSVQLITLNKKLLTSIRQLFLLSSPLGLKLFLAGLTLGYLRALTLYPLSDLITPALYAVRLLTYLALFFTLTVKPVKIPKIVFVIAGIITLLIGLLQYFSLPDMRIFQYLGWDDHLNRLTLPHYDPTFTGIMLALFLLTFFKLNVVAKFPLILITSIAILLTYARSVWLSLLLVVLGFIKNKTTLTFTCLAILVAVFLLPKRFGEGTNLLRTYSITSRINADTQFVKTYQWDLIFGRGFNTLPLEAEPSRYPNHSTGPNNSYLYLLATTGIIGLLGALFLMRSLYQTSPYRPLLAFFFLASIFNNVMFYPFALLWVLLIHATLSPNLNR
jgi:hypothetical protein